MNMLSEKLEDRLKDIQCELPEEKLLSGLSDIFKVLADPTRLKIIYALMNDELCVSHLTDIVGMEQSAVSHQLRTLRAAKLVRSRRSGKHIYYTIDDNHVSQILSIALTHTCEKEQGIK